MPRKAATPTLPDPVAPDVRLVRLDTLYPDPENVRVHPEANLKAIRDSLTAFGQQRPLVVMPDGMVLAGNGTLEAARQLGWQHIAVQVCTLPLDQARAYAVADNRTGELSSWNETGLATLLRNLHEQALPLPGWSEGELEKLCGPASFVDVEPEIDRAEQLREQYGVQVGQLWTLGRHRLACGDCTDAAAVEHLMAGKQAQMIFTDPPYGVEYDGGMKPRERLENDHVGTDIYLKAVPVLASVADAQSSLYLWYADAHVAAAAAAAAGYVIVAQIIWAKNHAQFMSSAHYHGKHEPCFYGHKRGKTARWYGPANEVTLWECDRAPVNEYHPTQKPVPLAIRAITNSAAPGDVVLDGFLGGGTTLIACEQLQRHCYAIDIDPAYVAVSLHRWATLTGQQPVLVEP